jgi:hypothetical protein
MKYATLDLQGCLQGHSGSRIHAQCTDCLCKHRLCTMHADKLNMQLHVYTTPPLWRDSVAASKAFSTWPGPAHGDPAVQFWCTPRCSLLTARDMRYRHEIFVLIMTSQERTISTAVSGRTICFQDVTDFQLEAVDLVLTVTSTRTQRHVRLIQGHCALHKQL